MEFVSKILICGDGAVGKTSLRRNFAGFNFNSTYMHTIGAELSIVTKEIKFDDNDFQINSIKYFVWDLAGQPTFSSVRPRYYQGGDAVFLVYDITSRESFQNIKNWIQEIKTYNSNYPIPMILVANKIDLKDEVDYYITTSEGIDFVQELTEIKSKNEIIDALYIETSALTGENVNAAFEEIGKLLVQSKIN